MDLGIKGRVALITGSGRGIGFACAEVLAKEGVKIVINDINKDAISEAVNKLSEKGYEAFGVVTNVSVTADVEDMVSLAVEKFGSIDILVNNAGFTRDKYLAKMPEEDWDAIINTILKGAYLCTKEVVPHMMKNKWGRVINISSRAHFGNPGQTNYSAAKAGLIGFSNALAHEQGKFNITSNSIAPGLIETPLVKSLHTYEMIKNNAMARQPIQRMGHVDDIANAVAFLASERAGFITGETLHVTGGRYST